ncbi:major facilitator superfamily domain-containing protein [Xylariales sp. PMI_506]|nr:major facilitator superfamily domain-containing protein [Xylariales sp. PMI_506]
MSSHGDAKELSVDEKSPKLTTGAFEDDDSSITGPVDAAWQYLEGHQDAQSSVDLAAVRTRIDWRIVPLMFLCYVMQFLDKVCINYGAVMGMTTELNLTGNQFSNVATFMFTAVLCFEVPNTYLLQKVPAAKWLGLNVALWGVATACGAAAKDYQTLLVSRIFVGIFEATIGPSLLLISGKWYTKSEQAPRFSFWFVGLGVAQILGGLVSWGFQHITGQYDMSSWRIMFLTLGCITVVVGIATGLLIPDSPMTASWLSDEEKVALLKHLSVNQTGIENRTFRPKEILEALADPQLWLLFFANVCISVSSGVVTTYSATLIKNLGYTGQKAALMNMPGGAVSIFFILTVGLAVRRTSHRWAWIIASVIPGIIGGALMSFTPTTNKAGVLAGLYLVNAVTAPLPMFYSLVSANFAGHTKRAFGAAVVSGSFYLGNIIGPQTFQAKDAPVYKPAKIAVMATLAASVVLVLMLFGYYVWANNSRRSADDEDEDAGLSREAWIDLTDKQNKRFRYVY